MNLLASPHRRPLMSGSTVTAKLDPRPEAMEALSIRLFGSMEVRVGRQPLPHPRSRKALWLLALLMIC